MNLVLSKLQMRQELLKQLLPNNNNKMLKFKPNNKILNNNKTYHKLNQQYKQIKKSMFQDNYKIQQ